MYRYTGDYEGYDGGHGLFNSLNGTYIVKPYTTANTCLCSGITSATIISRDW
ncbi:MAG TPA: hypothetical protein PLD87_11680 [Bacteroidia bacterium]|nr:hypothetical protein [Bacteroidia bacterium]